MDATIPMDNLLPGNGQSSIADAIWGPQSTEYEDHDRDAILKWYLRYCEDEKSFVLRRNPSLLEEMSIVDLIQYLKTNARKEKIQLVSGLAGNSELAPGMVAFDLAVRLVFLTSCMSVSQETFGGDLFRPRWNEHESLESYIGRVYPRDKTTPQDVKSIRVDKLAVGYLTSYAKLDLIWTHRLTDHLMLLKRPNRKTLHIFRHPAFLKVSLETLEGNSPGLGQSTADALSLYANIYLSNTT
jgi:hypothetical protein